MEFLLQSIFNIISEIPPKLIPVLSLLTGLGISYQDIQTQRISIWLLGIFVVLSTLMGVTREWENGFINSGLTLTLMITLIIMVSLYERIRRKSLLGSGDKILLVCCCGWLDVSQIPYLLILAGTFGTVIALLLKMTSNHEMDRPIPFAPGILGALVILGWLHFLRLLPFSLHLISLTVDFKPI